LSSLLFLTSPVCLSASDPLVRQPHTTQIAAGLNCFRRLLPRGSEGETGEYPQVNIPVKTYGSMSNAASHGTSNVIDR
jgi:hypothetical protein